VHSHQPGANTHTIHINFAKTKKWDAQFSVAFGILSPPVGSRATTIARGEATVAPLARSPSTKQFCQATIIVGIIVRYNRSTYPKPAARCTVGLRQVASSIVQ
jgi:hypothetical protein